MSKVRFVLVALICASPATLLWDGLIMQGLVAGVAALALSITAFTARPGEAKFLVSTVRPFIAVAAMPALWILVQVLPIGAFAHPVWASLAAALGRPVSSSISIDPSVSIISLGQYLSVMAIFFVTAAVAADRQRAEWVLFALAGACAAIALILLTQRRSHPGAATLAPAQAINCAAMGAVIASAACIRTVERYETRHKNQNRSVPILCGTFAASCIAFAICAAALVLEGTREALFAAGCGVVATVSVFIIRRFGLGAWGSWTIVAVSIGVSVMLAASQLLAHRGSILSAFATSPSGPAERMLADAPLVGTGAGTFGSLVPIYSEIDNPSPSSVPSTAAALAIELGTPALCFIAVVTAAIVIALLRSSLHRGRDSFYPAMGGGCLLTLSVLAFVNAGLLGTASSMIAAAVLGVGIVQTKGRSAQIRD